MHRASKKKATKARVTKAFEASGMSKETFAGRCLITKSGLEKWLAGGVGTPQIACWKSFLKLEAEIFPDGRPT